LFHHPLVLGALLFIAVRLRSRLLLLILAGLLFHVSLDVIHGTQMSSLKSSLSEQAGFTCPECGKYDEALQLHTLHFARNIFDRYNPQHFVVLCAACHERAHKNKNMKQQKTSSSGFSSENPLSTASK
jgi:cytochrome c553